MWKCETCERHVLPVVQVCPFCTTLRVASWSTAVVTPIVLSACYGAPPCADDQVTDQDNDGFVVPLPNQACWPAGEPDCDDTDATVNPGAAEICGDGIDNNCDGIEADPSQIEVCNGLDDDCDGDIDEDDACNFSDTGTDTGPDGPSTAAASISIDWSNGLTTCSDAGVQTLTIALRTQVDQPASVSQDVACAETVIVEGLPEGAWLIDAKGEATDGLRTWQSASRVISLTPDETESTGLELTCSAEDPTHCG
ncbi:MAG: putative metal-binding motif-containing protein [Myxococcota bacterium]